MSESTCIASGVWPVMLTPFTATGQIDWSGVDQLVEWYLQAGVAGLFAVCLSSEMEKLTTEEQLALVRHVTQRVDGRIQVVASNYGAGTLEQQITAIRQVWDLGVNCVVCLSGMLAGPDETPDDLKRNVELILAQTGDIPLGLYECPLPHHRLLAPDELAWLLPSGRFRFLKDTSCNIQKIAAKARMVARWPEFRYFNAHTQTLLASLQLGLHGFCGVAANFCPALYVWLCREFAREPNLAAELQLFLDQQFAVAEIKYPASAKQYLQMIGVDIGPLCRRPMGEGFSAGEMELLLNSKHEIQAWQERLGLLVCR